MLSLKHSTLMSLLLEYSDTYDIDIQLWPDDNTIFIGKDKVNLTSYSGDFGVILKKSVEYLNRITGAEKEKPPVVPDPFGVQMPFEKALRTGMALLQFSSEPGDPKNTSEVWLNILNSADPSKVVQILDPDGWDRNNYDYSFKTELVSRETFLQRLYASTITIRTKTNES